MVPLILGFAGRYNRTSVETKLASIMHSITFTGPGIQYLCSMHSVEFSIYVCRTCVCVMCVVSSFLARAGSSQVGHLSSSCSIGQSARTNQFTLHLLSQLLRDTGRGQGYHLTLWLRILTYHGEPPGGLACLQTSLSFSDFDLFSTG